MENSFLEFFNKFKHLKLSDLRDIYRISTFKKIKAGDLIAREGEHFNYALAILKGMIRTYVLEHSGEERTVRIVGENSFAGSAACLFGKGPSFEFLEAVEDCWVVSIDIQKLKEMSNTNIRISQLWSDAVSEELVEAVKRIQFFVTLTPEQRYKQFLDESPELLQRVPQKFLASYIGVTTVSLSRIRSRLLNG